MPPNAQLIWAFDSTNRPPTRTSPPQRTSRKLHSVIDVNEAEPQDVASEHPQVVAELLAKFQETARNVPKLAPYISDYLFRAPAKGQRPPLMRLIGGDLNYDRVPKTQQHFIDPTKTVHQP